MCLILFFTMSGCRVGFGQAPTSSSVGVDILAAGFQKLQLIRTERPESSDTDWNSTSMKLKYRNREGEYDLFEESDGSLVISVVCGTIGLYEARVRLNDEETRRYQEEGEAYLDDLATRIRKEESKYKSRMI